MRTEERPRPARTPARSPAKPPAARAPRARKYFPRPDRWLFAIVMVMLAFGAIMILSASSVESFTRYHSSFLYFKRQMTWVILGLALMLLVSRADYRRLRRFIRPFLWLVLGGLLAVLVPGIGRSRGGSTRWLAFGSFAIQPSEFAKLALVLFSAHVLEQKGRAIGLWRELVVPVLPMTGAVCALVILQPDLGTALVVGGSVLAVMFLSGGRGRHLLGIVGASGLAAAVLTFTEGYRRARLFSFLDPWADPLNSGYQIIQGQIALGSGHLFGVGLGASRQKWSYVPNAHTDFIYAIVGEELGLIGTLVILALFVFLIYLGIRIARRAPDRFGFLVAGGVTALIGLQALINMAAVNGMLPITGVPLPLISFGGSSLLLTMAAIGLLMSIAREAPG